MLPRYGSHGSMRKSDIDTAFDYAILGSGSSANAYVIRFKGRALMVDNGFSLKETLARLALAGIDPASLDGVFLTHTHGDHLRGVGPLCRRLKIPLFSAAGLTLPDSVGRIDQRYELSPGKSYRFSWMECLPFKTSHDADKSLGYSFTVAGERISIITDTGEVSDEMAGLAAESRLLFLESNYDEQMLRTGPYPPFLQARIASSRGHLSNLQAAELLQYLLQAGRPKKTYLCHLSDNNNDPRKVAETLQAAKLDGLSYKIASRGELIRDILSYKEAI